MNEDFHKPSLHFYEWECRYRGYYHFEHPINLEIPYHPFQHREPTEHIDDGRVLSFFEKVGSYFSDKKQEETEDIHYDFPVPLEKSHKLKVCILSFRTRSEISQTLSLELINMLSLARDPLSFEIIGTGDDIRIQISSSDYDYERVVSHIHAYFPSMIIEEGEVYDFPFKRTEEDDVAIVDFGLEYEFMLPISQSQDFRIDPLTSIIAQCESLRTDSTAVFQFLFQAVDNPLSKDIIHSVSDGGGGSFFPDNPEMVEGAKSKISAPLFSCVMRIATQGTSANHSEYLAKELIAAICFQSDSGINNLIPLSNEGYEYNQHLKNIYYRTSHRLGMILNAHELVNYVHYPNITVVSEKLGGNGSIGKLASYLVQDQDYFLGINKVGKDEIRVSLSDEHRLSHTHISGATGMGKSTLLANMFIQDVKAGNGCVMFDPHGDIVEDILKRIPESRQNDVIILDPSDSEYPVGFNLLHAETEAERLVLSSDLVGAFKKYATAWGDRMTSVLANAIDTFLESDIGGTLIELKRFLLEKPFRDTFLKTVNDPQLQYYWKHDFSLVTRSSLSPLLTRIDTFLRPKMIRMMFAQKSGLDIADIVNNNKILLVKLSQGLIGKGNAHLLGTLLVSKLGQVALGRQALAKSERRPFYVYMDEFQNLITDSISEMLSGVRKYGMGLVLAHQDMEQLSGNPELRESILSNPNVRICFRLGDKDAKSMQDGFSGFDMNDLQSLERGKAIMRIGGASQDFNIAFPQLGDEEREATAIRNFIIDGTREKYAKPKVEVEQILLDLLPSFGKSEKEKETKKDKVTEPFIPAKDTGDDPNVVLEPVAPISDTSFEQEAEKLKDTAKKERVEREHEKLKVKIGTLAQEQGFRIVYEEQTESGGRVDIGLHNSKVKIACEISVTNTADYEVQNIQKCLNAEYPIIFMMSPDTKHLDDIQKKAKEVLTKSELKKVFFFLPELFQNHLLEYVEKQKPKEKIIKGYRVKVNYSETSSEEQEQAQKSIAQTVLDSMKKKK
jgi:hypothetical protein